MNSKLNVLDIKLDNNTAKENMRRIMKYMQTEPLSIVEIVSADVLVKSKDDENLKDNIAHSDLVVPGEKSVLELAGAADHKKLQEAEDRLFVKMLLHYFHKNQSSIFLLAQSPEDSGYFKDYLQEEYGKIRIVGSELVPDDRSADDMILNNINGAGADCVLSMLPSPMQERFAARNRILINARLWLGLGGNIRLPIEKKKNTVKGFIMKRFLKRQVEKQKKKENA